ncbi:diguanylate cyclase/phosphodiesterase (GGDEF/EAL) with PAS/PAC sensor(s) [Sulfurimonas gotlandica GD1]|uniref:Diguanylate cyclase/phosphodiesterase (GGDEF/EAL) with PAS/PAC sensor(S) n=1 Tax=Sulfurimonas gotlandica (strain DSM 19862 / JCM 16533 / GD1) TaxID=929558 RepID=B6BN98_SULGG|nr:diguanylate cyclase [Sulfurimonas gotlandica]EDZ61401.1 diguanylate cyclase/phosphodiesterase with PAS/PAC sensor [Sulfurimonas gotlandica GD1]EHP30968.1 diguanylate cyclase/phosphodiesterase (GGDEF/EAL) with PAS/PAC sensor(s) [Sulfurimonas gotlandica GD1]
MDGNFNKKFLKILVTIITPILVIMLVFSLYLYDRLKDEKKAFLFEKSAVISSMISNVASFDREYSKEKEFAYLPSTATISQVQNTFQSLDEKELQLEYLLGMIYDDHIDFIAYSGLKPPPVKLKDSYLVIPMRKALSGKSGVSVELNYKNEKVFASYHPIANTKWGLVVEQPYSRHIKPLYQTAMMSSFAVILLIIILYFILKRYDAKHQKHIQYSEHRFQQLVESSDDFIWEVNAHGVYKYASKQVENILGYTSQEVVGKTPFDFMTTEEAKKVAVKFMKLIEQEERIVNLENINIHKDGHEVYLLTSGTPFFDERGKILGYRGIDRDITPLKQKQKEIEHLAFYDTLTGLANRQNINDRISQEINYTRRNNFESALLFLDLDDFKVINDTHGHDHGDEVLKTVSHRILKSIRSFDIAGRIGGDEFVILVRGVQENNENSLDHLESLLKRVLQEINEPIVVNSFSHHVGVSIGVAILPRDGDNLEEILKCADNAMYEAKHLGKNRVVFHKKVI